VRSESSDERLGFRFALPPSLGDGPVKALARQLADVLDGAGFSTIIPTRSYEQLVDALSTGEVDAAWGPPLVCARVEAAGGRVALRAVRHGGVTYRAVLVCRATDTLDLKTLGGARKPRAVWVDEASVGGRLLARHHLKSRGLEPAAVFEDERLLGSYRACLDEVLDFGADVTSTYAHRGGIGYEVLCGARAAELRTLAYTAESPNDGLVLSPRLAAAVGDHIAESLDALVADPASLRVLTQAFEVGGFDVPPAGLYRPLLALL
jgi:ABC-type phosphate/phosphonate transport system substrate-binding protein